MGNQVEGELPADQEELDLDHVTRFWEGVELEKLKDQFCEHASSEFQFPPINLSDHLSEAERVLKVEEVSKLRLRLVPGFIKEEQFWTIFFHLAMGERAAPLGKLERKLQKQQFHPSQPIGRDEGESRPRKTDPPSQPPSELGDQPPPLRQANLPPAQSDPPEAASGTESFVMVPGGIVMSNGGTPTGKKKKKKKKKRRKQKEAQTEVEPVVVILRKKFCHLYRVPPQRSALGHYAEDWNLSQSIWCGTLHIIEYDLDRIQLRFLNAEDKELYLESEICDWTKGDLVTKVVDSSRFWSFFIVNPDTGKKLCMGFGFSERDDAQDVRFAIAGHRDRSLRHRKGAEESQRPSAPDGQDPEKEDLTLPEKDLKPVADGDLLLEKPKEHAKAGDEYPEPPEGGALEEAGPVKEKPAVTRQVTGLPSMDIRADFSLRQVTGKPSLDEEYPEPPADGSQIYL